MPNEDMMLYQSHLKIRELEEKLKAKDEEIKEVRLKRFEELEPEVLRDKVSNARALKRSKHMDEWSMEQLCAWFEEMKMGEHVPYLLANRVDGLLFINLTDSDWAEIGIVNKIQIKKLQLIMKTFRIRFTRRQAGKYDPDDDDLSDYAPSELSDILGEEDSDEEGGSDADSDDNFAGGGGDQIEVGSQMSEEDLTEEERIERELDAKNMHIETMVTGDEVNFPLVGDVVRVRYTCTLVATGKVCALLYYSMFSTTVHYLTFNNHYYLYL
jgi:SAM domain (Sterile alpha motif)